MHYELIGKWIMKEWMNEWVGWWIIHGWIINE